MAGNPARLRQGRETHRASARRERAAQLESTQGWGRVPVIVLMDEAGSSSGSRSRLTRVSSSRQEEVREEEEVRYQDDEEIPDADPSHGEEEEEEDGFLGGPRDISVPISYHEHVARHVWEGKERATLKMVNHAWKIFDLFKPEAQWFNDVVTASGLSELCMTGYTTISHDM
ncbi:uncharacterized protein LOC131598118 [Vicia villosa]|uniref:uncharacterized protein LOC131598118 n=1 Tax=Vicia villosa TaxID=3911 RepID=UPI00273A8D7C|nr:uncharacterized protein LOC131598118 [Vicia villosa]